MVSKASETVAATSGSRADSSTAARSSSEGAPCAAPCSTATDTSCVRIRAIGCSELRMTDWTTSTASGVRRRRHRIHGSVRHRAVVRTVRGDESRDRGPHPDLGSRTNVREELARDEGEIARYTTAAPLPPVSLAKPARARGGAFPPPTRHLALRPTGAPVSPRRSSPEAGSRDVDQGRPALTAASGLSRPQTPDAPSLPARLHGS